MLSMTTRPLLRLVKPEPKNPPSALHADEVCPVCSTELVRERCKLICKSATCRHLVVATCSDL